MQRKKDKINRREFLTAIGGAAAVFSLGDLAWPIAAIPRRPREMLVYIGTYTSGNTKSEGIYVYKLDMDSGVLVPHKIVRNVIDPSFLVIDANRKHLYAVNETLEYEGKKSGAVSAFAIESQTGGLHFLNRQPSLGGAPCHISISKDNKFVLVANYVGGNVSVLPIERGGNLGTPIDLQQHSGTGPNNERQEAAHAHSISLDKNDRFAVACDLGADRAFIYKFDRKTGKLSPNAAQAFFRTKPGAGPRHFAFHPNGRLAFIINELDSSVTSLLYDEERGTLREIQTISTLPANWSGANTCADIHVSPDGKFLYGSNRGHDSLARYRIDLTSGRLELIEHVSTIGRTPRNFAIDPTGTFLLAANQTSDSVVTFRVSRKTGRLQPTGNSVNIPAPVCLKLILNLP